MGNLYPLTGVLLPETPPFATEGHLLGKIGEAAVSGITRTSAARSATAISTAAWITSPGARVRN
jgi:uncharacterized protein involved in outer membrane biogenesis